MKKSLKDSHVFGIIGVCAIVLLVLFSQTTEEPTFVFETVQPQVQVAQAGSASLTLSPALTTIAQGGQFTVNILLNTGGQNIFGVDINPIRFNPAILEVVDADTSKAGIQITPGTLMNGNYVNTVDNVAGTIKFTQIVIPPETGSPIPYNGAGTLATIRFKALGAGTSNATIEFIPGNGTDANVAGTNGDILTAVGNGTYTVTSVDSTAPTAPASLTATVISDKQINLAWPASTDNVGVTGYKLERCTGAACTSFALIASPTGLTHQDNSLSANTTYRYRVLAVDALNNQSTYSPIASGTTQPPPDTTKPVIGNITYPVRTATSITIAWPTDEPADTQVEYGRTPALGTVLPLNSTLSLTHSVSITGLLAGTSYNYRLKSKDAAGNLATADNVFTTDANEDNTPPSVPAGLTATANSETKIQLSWLASTDPVVAGEKTSGIKHYEIYRGTTLITTTAQLAHLDEGLTPDTAYSYQVLAVDEAGKKSAKSVAVTGKTLAYYSLAVQRKISIVPEGAPATKRNVSGTIEFVGANYRASIETDNLGKYIMSVPEGKPATVTLRAEIPGYLSKSVANVDLRDTALLDVVFPTLLAGNFEPDTIINAVDYSYLNSKWGTADQLADVNRDGAVNTLDFAFLAVNWLREAE